MNQRIHSIFWLMTACIVGINGFQGYWLWTTYQLNRQQFSQTVQDALFEVLQQQQLTAARQLVDGKSARDKPFSRLIIHQYNSSSEARQTRVFVNQHVDSLLPLPQPPVGKRSERVVVTHKATNRAPNESIVPPADTLARQISSLLLLNWAEGTPVNLTKLKTAYRAELRRHLIDTDFKLDTLTIHPGRASGNLLIFRGKSDKSSLKTNDTLRTIPAPLNPVRNLFAQASFTTPTFYLLGRMGWLLGCSLLLLGLTTGCFLFMLVTILRQKKLSEVKNDFINNMTHELKTPIATVTAAVEAMQYFGALNDPQKTQTYLTISRNNLQRLSDLVEKVLNLAVEEKRELIIHPEPIKLASLVNDLITNHQLRAQKPVTFDVTIPEGTLVPVDRVHFSNALNNLIDNAINYSREQVAIRLAFGQDANSWYLSVVDNGIGIPKAYQSAIFDRFFRVPTGDLHPVKGFGLGLAYVRHVVEQHGGRIRVSSEPGKGSEFVLTF